MKNKINGIMKIMTISLILISAIFLSGCVDTLRLAIVPGNLVQNGDFENTVNSLTAWTTTGTVESPWDNPAASRVAQLSGVSSSISQQITFSPSTSYKLTFRSRNWNVNAPIKINAGGQILNVMPTTMDYASYSVTFTTTGSPTNLLTFTSTDTTFIDDIVLLQTGGGTGPFIRKVTVNSNLNNVAGGGKVNVYKNGVMVGTATQINPYTLTLNSGDSWSSKPEAYQGFVYNTTCWTNPDAGTYTCISDPSNTPTTVGSTSIREYIIMYDFDSTGIILVPTTSVSKIVVHFPGSVNNIITVGQKIYVEAVAYDQNNNLLGGVPITWSSDPPGLIEFSPDASNTVTFANATGIPQVWEGKTSKNITGKVSGIVTIRATSGSVTGSNLVYVHENNIIAWLQGLWDWFMELIGY